MFVALLRKESRLLSKTVKKRGVGSVSANTISLIGELVTSIRVDRGALKFSKSNPREEEPLPPPWPFPQSHE